MFLGHPGRPVGIFHQPTRNQFAVVAVGRVGPCLPRVVAVQPLFAQILIVRRVLVVVAVRMHAVIALERSKAAFRGVHTDDRFRVDAEPLHALGIGDHVGLADQHAVDSDFPQVIAQRRLADPQREAVPRRAVAAHIASGIEAHTRRTADGRLYVGAVKSHTTFGQAVDVRGLQGRMAIAGQVIPAQLVGHDPKYVSCFCQLFLQFTN